MNFRDLKIMPMQMERMQVVALVDESESIAATLMNLDRLALLVRLTVDRPHIESAFRKKFHVKGLVGTEEEAEIAGGLAKFG